MESRDYQRRGREERAAGDGCCDERDSGGRRARMAGAVHGNRHLQAEACNASDREESKDGRQRAEVAGREMTGAKHWHEKCHAVGEDAGNGDGRTGDRPSAGAGCMRSRLSHASCVDSVSAYDAAIGRAEPFAAATAYGEGNRAGGQRRRP
jgi:hypothetical protein